MMRASVATLEVNKTTEMVIGAAIEVHRHLGPGLLESAYEDCLCHELTLRKITFKPQFPLPVSYKG
ncbi:MAG: GxxExxY protein [Anaerolineae bacterium]|nr:GxxExxY protein [Anaerolineae bacterium]